MAHPATTTDITAILDRLTLLPKLGAPLRNLRTARASLLAMALESIAKLGTPPSEIDRLLRAMLHDIDQR